MTIDIDLRGLPEEIRDRVKKDLESRKRHDGYAFNLDNDWDLHLYARLMNLEGRTKEDARLALSGLPLSDIPEHKRESYVDDVLCSVVVGYEPPEKSLPVYLKIMI